ncbi:DUF3318 domain-containing protein [Euhalothece natronophila Z-M001]|uniref:DUF3318 domain-containing protein n=1 Tax=Euhalothece natronophila Z-M001 TaxID=522448 RepID=A0A5B8NNB7_9CHRO|nr:DUF3318 domain-containing protein [Euhalothece natronophila]QDZ40477.1 DUF3318 domain-containing protein [Euhalothece natronophila Z-M001]
MYANQDEVRHLIDLMPASGRMYTKIIPKPKQSRLIDAPFPLPWQRGARPIYINFDLWTELSRAERDLALLRSVCWLTEIKWFKPDLYQGVVTVGVIGTGVEMLQGDAIGVIVGASLAVLAGSQIWRRTRSIQTEVDADEIAIRVAQRRGYEMIDAAQALLDSIEKIAEIEGRANFDFTELVRIQNLRKLAGRSEVGVPEEVRKQ